MLRRCISLAAAVLLAAMAAVLVWDQASSVVVLGPCPDESSSAQQSDQEKCTVLTSTLFKGQPPVLSAIGGWLDTHNGAVTGVATVFLTIITCGLVWIAREQHRTTRIQLRASVSVKVPDNLPPRFDPTKGPWCSLTITNTGVTPAYELTHWMTMALGPPGYEEEFPREEAATPHPMTLAPTANIQVVSEGPAPRPGDADAFARDEIAAYVFGEIHYLDAFKTRRFYRYRYTFTASDIQGGVLGLRLCRTGNEAN